MSTPATLHAISSSVEHRTNLQTASEGKDAAECMAQFTPDSLYKRFGLAENPFGMTPDPRYLYEALTHHEAFNSLVTGIECGLGFQALIAAPGLGKTTLLFRLVERFESTASTAFLFQTQCSSRDLLQYILSELGSPSRGQDVVEMHESLNRLLFRESQAGRRVIVVIDEAQNMDNAVLETVRLLSDFETKRQKLMQIILVGQPQLAHKLAHAELAQLVQRISLLMRLVPLGPEETKQYVRHRLMIAGHNGAELFTSAALETIWEHSEGVPRLINNLCFNALVLAHSFNQYEVDQFLVREVAARLDLHALINDQSRPARRPWVAVTGRYTSQYIADTASDQKEKANDLENAFRLIAERVQAVTGATGAAVGFLEGGYMVCRGTSGSGTPDEGSRINVDSGLTGECFRTRQILLCDDTEVDTRVDRIVCRQLGIRSIVSIPLSEEGSTVGLIEIFSGRTNAFRNLHLLKLEAMLQSMILKRAGARTTGRDKPDMPSASPTSEPAHGTDKISNRESLTRQTGLHPKETPPGLDLSQTRPASADAVPLKVTSQLPPNAVSYTHLTLPTICSV